MGRIILVTGTPGVGKTRFAKVLARKVRGAYASLGQLALAHKYITATDRARLTKVVNMKLLSGRLYAMSRALKGYLVAEGHYAHLMPKSRIVSKVFILRSNPRVLERRLRRRGYPQRKLAENLWAEILGAASTETIRHHGQRKACELDTTLSVRRPVEYAVRVLAGKRASCLGKIDWLGQLNPRDLERLARLKYW